MSQEEGAQGGGGSMMETGDRDAAELTSTDTGGPAGPGGATSPEDEQVPADQAAHCPVERVDKESVKEAGPDEATRMAIKELNQIATWASKRHQSFDERISELSKRRRPPSLVHLVEPAVLVGQASNNVSTSQGALPLVGSKHSASDEDDRQPIYPFTDAVFIEQEDVLEDGDLPEPRAKVFKKKMELIVHVGDALHLPASSSNAGVPSFTFEISLEDHRSSTPTVKGSAVIQMAQFRSRLALLVDEEVVDEARQAKESGEHGPVIICTLYECARFLRSDVVGQTFVFLKDLLRCEMPDMGNTTPSAKRKLRLVETTCFFINGSGKEVVGEYGSPTEIRLSFDDKELLKKSVWKMPTLEETLATCEDPDLKLSIVKARVVVVVGDSPGLAIDLDDEKVNDSTRVFDSYCWREQLEKYIDSIWASSFVITVVILDMFLLLYYGLFTGKSEETPMQKALTLGVLAFFFCELMLRLVAKGRRFFREIWNPFDLTIITISSILMCAKYASGPDVGVDFNSQITGINILRMVSRLAVFTQMFSKMSSLHKSQQLSGRVTSILQNTVSQNRRRFKRNGFDLDLTYITNRVIAMSAPAFGGHSAYRNDIHVVSRFLSLAHYGHMYIFNLCDTFASSDGIMGNYNPKMFFGQVLRIPMEDHAPPLLFELLKFCREASKFLLANPQHVIAVHCKGGKGRTGVCVAALLLWTGHRRCALDALELFTVRRTQNYNPETGLDSTMKHSELRPKGNQTVEGPSQIRYVHYVEAVLYSGIDPHQLTMFEITSLDFVVGEMQRAIPWEVSFKISCDRSPAFESDIFLLGGTDKKIMSFPVNQIVWGDVRIDFYRHRRNFWGLKKAKVLFFNVFNTSFYADKTLIRFPKKKLDILSKDKHNKKTDEDFSMTVQISREPTDVPELKMEREMTDIFIKHGTMKIMNRGDRITWGETTNERIILIYEGFCEAIILENIEECFLEPHPHGNEVGSFVDNEKYTRRPQSLIAGAGMVIGHSKFLSVGKVQRCPEYIVGSNVAVVYEITKKNHTKATGKHLSEEEDASDISHQPPRATTSFDVHHCNPTEPSSQGVVAGSAVSSTFGDVQASKGTGESCSIQGMSFTEMAAFYRGVAISMAAWQSKLQMESIRIRECKALNDRETIMHDTDETEKLRMCCVNLFKLPVTEKVLLIMKCSVSKTDITIRQCRLIALSNYIFLDTAYYGPEVCPTCLYFDASQLQSVNNCHTPNTLIVTLKSKHDFESRAALLGDFGVYEALDMSKRGDIPIMEGSAAGISTGQAKIMKFKANAAAWAGSMIMQKKRKTGEQYNFSFNTSDQMNAVYDMFSRMCERADETRRRDEMRPLDDPVMQHILNVCSHTHNVRKGQQVPSLHEDSLFFVRHGELRLVTNQKKRKTIEDVDALSRSTVGAVPFVLGKKAVLLGVAKSDAIVVELPRSKLSDVLKDDPVLEAHFYHIICQVIDREMKYLLEISFPGEWMHKSATENFMLTNSGNASYEPLYRSGSVRRRQSGSISMDLNSISSQSRLCGWVSYDEEVYAEQNRISSTQSNFTTSGSLKGPPNGSASSPSTAKFTHPFGRQKLNSVSEDSDGVSDTLISNNSKSESRFSVDVSRANSSVDTARSGARSARVLHGNQHIHDDQSGHMERSPSMKSSRRSSGRRSPSRRMMRSHSVSINATADQQDGDQVMSEIELAARVRKPVMHEVSKEDVTDFGDVEGSAEFEHWRSEASTLFNLKDTLARATTIRHEVQELLSRVKPMTRRNTLHS